MRKVVPFTIILLVALSSTGCDGNGALQRELGRLSDEVAQNREKCDHMRDLESRDRREIQQRLVRIGKINADKEWDDLARKGEAGTGALVLEAKLRRSDSSYVSKRDEELAMLRREIALFEADEPRRREDRQLACDSLLASNEAYISAKAKLATASTTSN